MEDRNSSGESSEKQLLSESVLGVASTGVTLGTAKLAEKIYSCYAKMW